MRVTATMLTMMAAANLATGCNDEGGTQETDTSVTDTTIVDTTIVDTSVDDADVGDTTTVAETTVAETTDTAEEVTPGPYGFGFRHPRARVEPPCDVVTLDPGTAFAAADADHVCTFVYPGASHTLYFQSSPSGCYSAGMFPLPLFTTQGWVSKEGVVTALAAARYDYGGNHHNDVLAFTLDGVAFTYGHSSFGFGFRSCAPPDCLQRMDAANPQSVADDGCTPARTHPIVCSEVQADATFAPLVDTFQKCPGDPNR